MTLLHAANSAADALEQLTGDLLALESEIARGTADREHLQSELASARRRLRSVTQDLHDARRATRAGVRASASLTRSEAE